ncbi:MAG: SGNH/GDSL hydrolase family protein [Clostridia bacterium]|nr:SGNH/GDSL hydrolase family protein [Clostridia bacterium]
MDITKYYASPDEQPLDVLKPDGGFTGIFRTIACVGDSLASGEFESTQPDGSKGYHDLYEYSWGQYMARAAGCTAYNFSRGGMTAKWYLESWGEENDVWNPDKAAQAYVIALGCNDLFGLKQELGTADDIDLENPENNAPTFAGMYGKIIQKYLAIQSKARFFLVTMPRESAVPSVNPGDVVRAAHAKLLWDIAAKFPFAYVIDLHRYAPVYDAKFKEYFWLGGHLNAAGYLLTAQMMMTYIDYYVRKYPDDFAQVGFIGTPWHNAGRKW